MNHIPKTLQEAFEADRTATKSVSVGWIQHKGSSLCMDVHCQCGNIGHIDSDFCYMIQCAACHRVFYVSGYVELVEMDPTEEETQRVKLAEL